MLPAWAGLMTLADWIAESETNHELKKIRAACPQKVKCPNCAERLGAELAEVAEREWSRQAKLN